MLKSELVHQIAKNHSLPLMDAEMVVNAFFEGITEALKNGRRVELRGFGSFVTKSRSGRTGRNPKTGEKVVIPAKIIPSFKAGRHLLNAINNQPNNEENE